MDKCIGILIYWPESTHGLSILPVMKARAHLTIFVLLAGYASLTWALTAFDFTFDLATDRLVVHIGPRGAGTAGDYRCIDKRTL